MPARDEDESRNTPEKQDLDAARTLVEVAGEQHAISTASNNGKISVDTGVETKAKASMEYSRKCPVTTCEYHHRGFLLKEERNKHTMTHFKGDIKCGCYICRFPGGKVFNDLEQLRSHFREYLRGYTNSGRKGFICELCSCQFDGSDFLKHLDDCIIHTVELEASGRARGCPMPSCSHHQRDFPSKHQREQHILKHHLGWLDCFWCSQKDLCYGAEEFRSHVSKEHLLDLSRIPCPVCRRLQPNGKALLEHLDSCVTLDVEWGVRKGWKW